MKSNKAHLDGSIFREQDMQSPIPTSVQIEAFIWDRDSHGLYDYESKSIVRQSMKCSGCAMISRKGQELKSFIPTVDQQEDYSTLMSVVFMRDSYWVYHCKSLWDETFKNHVDRVWRVVKYENHIENKTNCYQLAQEDVIKFGRVRFKVKKLVLDSKAVAKMKVEKSSVEEKEDMSSATSRLNDQSQGQFRIQMTTIENDGGQVNSEPDTRMTMTFHNKEGVGFDGKILDQEDPLQKHLEEEMKAKQLLLKQKTDKSASDQLICRICLSEEEADHPLISPCSCTGSMKNIHLSCLKEWLEGKKHMKETPVVNSYIWKNLECEICKSTYSDVAQLKDGTEVSLLNYTVHADARMYMVIESVTNTTSKTIHVINFSQRRKIKVGRGQNAEVRITDISVSRFHSQIKLTKHGTVQIEDNQSKFGTLIQMKAPVQVRQAYPLYLQIGRCVLVLFQTQRFSCFQRCCCIFRKMKKKDNCLQFQETFKFFPSEYQSFFEKQYKSQSNSSVNKSNQILPDISVHINQGASSIIEDRNDGNASRLESQIKMGNRDDRTPTPYMQNTVTGGNLRPNDESYFNPSSIIQQDHSPRIGRLNAAIENVYQNDERQNSLAIEFVTNVERIDTENLPIGQNRRDVLNSLVNQMQVYRQARNINQGASLREDSEMSNGPENMNVNFDHVTGTRHQTLGNIMEEEKEEEKYVSFDANEQEMNQIMQEEDQVLYQEPSNRQRRTNQEFYSVGQHNANQRSLDYDEEVKQIVGSTSFSIRTRQQEEKITKRHRTNDEGAEEVKIKEVEDQDLELFDRNAYRDKKPSMFNQYQLQDERNRYKENNSVITTFVNTDLPQQTQLSVFQKGDKEGQADNDDKEDK